MCHVVQWNVCFICVGGDCGPCAMCGRGGECWFNLAELSITVIIAIFTVVMVMLL